VLRDRPNRYTGIARIVLWGDLPVGEPTDAELAVRIAEGGPAAAEAEHLLCVRMGPRLRAFACRAVFQPHLVSDLVQDVLLRMIEALRRRELQEPDKLAAFVLGIARNLVKHAARSDVTRRELRERHLAQPPVVDAGLEEVSPMRLEDCVGNLRERERVLLRMSFCEEVPAAAIAEHLKMTPENVRVSRHRVLKTLRACVEAPMPS
jgi:RNA polymerase sigma-70 factor, ECF subfamily